MPGLNPKPGPRSAWTRNLKGHQPSGSCQRAIQGPGWRPWNNPTGPVYRSWNSRKRSHVTILWRRLLAAPPRMPPGSATTNVTCVAVLWPWITPRKLLNRLCDFYIHIRVTRYTSCILEKYFSWVDKERVHATHMWANQASKAVQNSLDSRGFRLGAPLVGISHFGNLPNEYNSDSESAARDTYLSVIDLLPISFRGIIKTNLQRLILPAHLCHGVDER